jgi:PPOX class probable F420-dependent enzyme
MNSARLTIPESHRDLLSAPVAVLATVGQDGYPQVTAAWFLFDEDGLLKLSLNTVRQKVKNLQKNPKCSVLIVDPASPYRTLELRGDAELSPDPDYAFADKVGAKYGSDFRNVDRPGESRVMVTVHPLKVNTWG